VQVPKSETVQPRLREPIWQQSVKNLGRCELGDGLGALRNGVLGQLSRKDEADGCLDLARGHCRLFVVPCQLGCLRSNLLEYIIDEGVEDGHGLGADSSVWVHLGQGEHWISGKNAENACVRTSAS